MRNILDLSPCLVAYLTGVAAGAYTVLLVQHFRKEHA